MAKTNRLKVVGLTLMIFGGLQLSVSAQSSTNYSIDESFIGPGGTLDSSSPNFQLESGQSSVGNAGVGDSGSANYNAQSGSTTTSDPRLACALNTSNINFGPLSTAATVTGTATFSVLNYTAYNYVVSILGSPPSSGSHTLNDLNTNSGSVIGDEQFGINLVANTVPSVGTIPQQIPSSAFSFGAAAANYGTANSFRYNAGETIANGPKSSGQTDYTISYIVNTSTTTPGGSYTGNQTILCTGTY